MTTSEEATLDLFCDADEPDLQELVLHRVEGREAISTLYEYVLHLFTTVDSGLASETIDAWLAQPSRFTFGETQISGVVKEVRLLPTGDPLRVGYQATLVPQLWTATQTVHSRVYQLQSALAIICSILDKHGIAYKDSTSETYPVREYVVQYAESDFDFISRLMEHWGVFYYFDQQPDGEVLVLGDAPGSCIKPETHPELGYTQHAEAVAQGSVGALGRVHRPQTASVTVADYNWRSPYADAEGHMTERQLQLRVASPVDTVTGRGEEWRYGEHVKDEPEATFLGGVRAQERMARRVTYSGTMSARGLHPGHRVTLSGMPLPDLDQEYLLTETTSLFEAGELTASVWPQQFSAIPFSVPFRPPLRAPIPKIHGYMHAVVDGEVFGTAAPIDHFGRYKVLMPYDTVAAPGGGASRWIRMAQPSAGPHYGMHLPLHIGTEVAIIHLDGDADRPVIMGSVPNVDTVSPVVDANATQSRIRTRGNILFELEDDA